MKKKATAKAQPIDLSKCAIGQKVMIRDGSIASVGSFEFVGGENTCKLDGGKWVWANGRYNKKGKTQFDVVEIFDNPPAVPAPDQATTREWMVVNTNDVLYSASNAPTRKDAQMHHSGSTGQSWEQSLKNGDRLVRVEIKILRKTK